MYTRGSCSTRPAPISPLCYDVFFNTMVNGEGKAVLEFKWVSRHEHLQESGGIAPRVNFGATWRWVVSFTPRERYLKGTGKTRTQF
jgi:hypothetical protein